MNQNEFSSKLDKDWGLESLPLVDDLTLQQIRIDGGTQIRKTLDEKTIAHYSCRIAEGDSFPALDVYFDGRSFWLADGFHRFFARKRLLRERAMLAQQAEDDGASLGGGDDKPVITCNIMAGSQRDAVLHAIKANQTHGRQRTNADKRNAVERMLDDDEWRQWSDHAIASVAGVSHAFVSSVRRSCVNSGRIPNVSRTTGLDGRTRERPDEPIAATVEPKRTFREVLERCAETHIAKLPGLTWDIAAEIAEVCSEDWDRRAKELQASEQVRAWEEDNASMEN